MIARPYCIGYYGEETVVKAQISNTDRRLKLESERPLMDSEELLSV